MYLYFYISEYSGPQKQFDCIVTFYEYDNPLMKLVQMYRIPDNILDTSKTTVILIEHIEHRSILIQNDEHSLEHKEEYVLLCVDSIAQFREPANPHHRTRFLFEVSWTDIHVCCVYYGDSMMAKYVQCPFTGDVLRYPTFQRCNICNIQCCSSCRTGFYPIRCIHCSKHRT